MVQKHLKLESYEKASFDLWYYLYFHIFYSYNHTPPDKFTFVKSIIPYIPQHFHSFINVKNFTAYKEKELTEKSAPFIPSK